MPRAQAEQITPRILARKSLCFCPHKCSRFPKTLIPILIILSFLKMKGIHIFCTSQAATAICPNMSEASSSSSAAQLGSGRAIDRYNPIIRDSRRNGTLLPPLSSHPKLTPKPQKHHSKNRQNSLKGNNEAKKHKILELDDEKLKRKDIRVDNSTNFIRKSWSCTKPGDFISPAGSTRYLLSDKAFLDVLSDFDQVLELVHDEPSKSNADKTDESCDGKQPSLSESPEQVVVLRVSLHCRGCERKMRKHISRMEGVKDFNIDFAAKKVTVIGDVTPLGVLASISKVKNAQLWPPTLSSLSPLNFSTPEFKNYKGAAGA